MFSVHFLMIEFRFRENPWLILTSTSLQQQNSTENHDTENIMVAKFIVFLKSYTVIKKLKRLNYTKSSIIWSHIVVYFFNSLLSNFIWHVHNIIIKKIMYKIKHTEFRICPNLKIKKTFDSTLETFFKLSVVYSE